MKIREILNKTDFLMSAEVFPPKRSGELENIIRTLRQLKSEVRPDYVSVTYGANGKGATTTTDAASVALDAFDLETVAHMTAVNMTKERLDEMLASLEHKGIESILTLRGDVRDDSKFYDFHHANELARYIKETHPHFLLMGAMYVEGHPESKNIQEDLDVLAMKIDSGIEHFITQMFFDNAYYYDFMDRAQQRGLHFSVEAGIMPITNVKQLGRSVSLSGASLPADFARLVAGYEDDMFDAGCDYAIKQIEDLRAHGAKGVHLYTMNSVRTAARIFDAIRK
jgi:methylenetetrahydrofolate reductase (NADPH)